MTKLSKTYAPGGMLTPRKREMKSVKMDGAGVLKPKPVYAIPPFIKRESTPTKDEGIDSIDLTTPKPSRVAQVKKDIVDLTFLTPSQIKKEKPDVIDLCLSSPVRRPFDFRSPSVIEITSDSEDGVVQQANESDDSSDSDTFWTQRPKRTQPSRVYKNLFGSPFSSDDDPTFKPQPSANLNSAHLTPDSPTPRKIHHDPEIKQENVRPAPTSLQPALRIKRERKHAPKHPKTFVPPPRPPPRTDGPAEPIVEQGSEFETLDSACKALRGQEGRRGFQWKIAQTKLDPAGGKKKVVLKCRCAGVHSPTHSLDLDPADYREGRTVKKACQARANISRVAGAWYISRYDSVHNHDRELPPGLPARRPPTQEQRDAIAKMDGAGNLNRRQVGELLRVQDPHHTLESRQISNVLNAVRQEKRDEVKLHGGDVASILAVLDAANESGECWGRRILLDKNGVCQGIWWQSPLQADLTRRFSDLLLNDDSYNRNQYGYPLDIGIIIDNHGRSRNAWYAFHLSEDTETHCWVLRCHLEAAGRPPEAFFSDRSAALMAAVAQIMPEARHFTCLHHMLGNIADHVRPAAQGQAGWEDFLKRFWATYGAVSPDEFERLWADLVSKFPGARAYLENELYPTRRLWAWAWVGKEFTAGIQTNGRVESENRVNKVLGGPKKTLFEVFTALNARTREQTTDELVRVRQSSRQKHPGQLEQVFRGPLAVIRAHAGQYALQQSYKQMESSMFYSCEVMQRPSGTHQWVSDRLPFLILYSQWIGCVDGVNRPRARLSMEHI